MAPALRGLWLRTNHFCSSLWGRAQTSKANAHRPPRPGSRGSSCRVLCGCSTGGLWLGRTGGVLRTRAGAHPLPRHCCCVYPFPSWASPSGPAQATVSPTLALPAAGELAPLPMSASGLCLRAGEQRFTRTEVALAPAQGSASGCAEVRCRSPNCGACPPTQHQCPPGKPAAGSGFPPVSLTHLEECGK